MNLWLISSCFLVAVGLSASQPQFSLGNGNNDKCEAKSGSFKTATANFLNCLGEKIEQELHGYQLRKSADTLAAQTERVKDAFRGSSCNLPPQALTASLSDVKSFLKNDMKFSKVVSEDLVDAVSDVIWAAAKNDGLTICFLGHLREKFLEYIDSQTEASIPSKLGLLDPIPTFRNGDKQIDWARAKKAVNQMLIAALAANKCSSKQALKNLNKKIYDDVCKCKKGRYCKCIEAADETCPDINKAVKKILENPGVVISKEDVKDKAFQCYWDHEVTRQGGADGIEKAGLKLQSVIGKLEKSDIDRMGEILKALINAFFTEDFCNAECSASDSNEC